MKNSRQREDRNESDANKQVPGKREFTAHYNGMRYQFPSDKELAMFLADPAKYEAKPDDNARVGARAASASITVVGTSGCAGCEHGVHPLGAPDTLGLAVNSSDGNVYIVEDAHRLYPALYEGRFDGHQLRVAGAVVKRQGKFVWLQPESLERLQ
jgi:YHS domain-containing protein